MMTDRIDNNAPIEIISLIVKGYFTKEEITEKLQITSGGFYRSLYQLRKAGFKIASSGFTYHILNFCNKLKLTQEDRHILAHMMNLACLLLPKEKLRTFKSFIRKVLFFGSQDDYNEIIKNFQTFKKIVLTEQFSEKLDKIRECLFSQELTRMILHSGRMLFMKPLNLDLESEKVYLRYLNRYKSKNREENLNIARIAKILKADEEDYVATKQEVIFELYGKLSQTYLLKRDERVVDSTSNSLIVASGTEDKEALFKRLLRYDTLCKVLHTKEDVKEFNALINKSLKNIGTKLDSEEYNYDC